MLYLEGDTSRAWPALAKVIAQAESVHMIALMYPGYEEDMPVPFEPAAHDEGLQPVTTFGDGETSTFSNRVPVDPELLDIIRGYPVERFEAGWDLALYRPQVEWVACVVPHERMILVADDELLGLLRSAGLDASEDRPEWW